MNTTVTAASDDDPNAPWLPKIPGPRPPSGVYPSQADEALRRVQARNAGLSENDFLAHEKASYVRPKSTGRRDVTVTMSNLLGR